MSFAVKLRSHNLYPAFKIRGLAKGVHGGANPSFVGRNHHVSHGASDKLSLPSTQY
jgi:hypothetical protein